MVEMLVVVVVVVVGDRLPPKRSVLVEAETEV